MKVKVNGKETQVTRIVDLPVQKIIRVFLPEIGMIMLVEDEYKGGLLGRNKAEFTKLVQLKIDELAKKKKKK